MEPIASYVQAIRTATVIRTATCRSQNHSATPPETFRQLEWDVVPASLTKICSDLKGWQNPQRTAERVHCTLCIKSVLMCSLRTNIVRSVYAVKADYVIIRASGSLQTHMEMSTVTAWAVCREKAMFSLCYVMYVLTSETDSVNIYTWVYILIIETSCQVRTCAGIGLDIHTT